MMMSKRLLLDQAQPLAPARGHDALVADPLQALGHGLGMGLVVVDHQDTDLLVHYGLGSCPVSSAGSRARD